MVKVPRYLLSLGLILAGLAPAALAARFLPDDPLQSMPKPLPVKELNRRKVKSFYDFFYNSAQPNRRPPAPALAINTLGEVPDSEWFTNRHGRQRMTREQLQRGPGIDHPPVPPFKVIGGKIEGITPGFVMQDARGNTYFVKPDPFGNEEMATGAEVVVSKFFYALGYFVPELYIVNVKRSELSVSRGVTIEGTGGRKRSMIEADLNYILRMVPPRPDGSYRVFASLKVPGKEDGPYRYQERRTDDPNDIVPHERRRDLRGLHVFCAWLNHTDSKGANSYDSLVEENGVRFVRHYLMDFGAAFGSDSDMPKNARFGQM
jgi:hypothetical protein